MNVLIIFTILSLLNVVGSTARSIIIINGNKWAASFISALYFAFYNIVLIYTVMDFPLIQKIIITFMCNLIGTYIVKYFEEKMRKDKLWKIEFTVLTDYQTAIVNDLELCGIPYKYYNLGRSKHCEFDCYAATHEESLKIKNIIDTYNGKYFVSESKLL